MRRPPSHMSRKRQAKTSLISGSITRSPKRPKNQGTSRGSTKISPTETPTNGTSQIVGLMNRIERPPPCRGR